ncbi:MAG TPA: hypothetical protein VGS99_03755 [Gammaproteobacteria bacterium]|nr:hypothetical protein [Gammaproteobacteria bacterium]
MKRALLLLSLAACGGGTSPNPPDGGPVTDAGPACDGGCTLCGIGVGTSLAQAEALAGPWCASNYDGGAGYVSWALPDCFACPTEGDVENEQLTAYVVDGVVQSFDSFTKTPGGTTWLPGLTCP